MLGFPFTSSSNRCRSCEGPLPGVTAADVGSAGDSSIAVLTVVLEGPVKKHTLIQYFGFISKTLSSLTVISIKLLLLISMLI